MLIYIARRLAWTVLVILVVLFVTFLVFFKLPNGDPALRFAESRRRRSSIELRSASGCTSTSPSTTSSATSSGSSSRGDENGWPGLGYSYSNYVPVKEQISERAPRTLWLIVGAATIWLVVGVAHRRALRGQAQIAHRPGRHGLRALRDHVRPFSGSA